jgi:hypothetical protein
VLDADRLVLVALLTGLHNSKPKIASGMNGTSHVSFSNSSDQLAVNGDKGDVRVAVQANKGSADALDSSSKESECMAAQPAQDILIDWDAPPHTAQPQPGHYTSLRATERDGRRLLDAPPSPMPPASSSLSPANLDLLGSGAPNLIDLNVQVHLPFQPEAWLTESSQKSLAGAPQPVKEAATLEDIMNLGTSAGFLEGWGTGGATEKGLGSSLGAFSDMLSTTGHDGGLAFGSSASKPVSSSSSSDAFGELMSELASPSVKIGSSTASGPKSVPMASLSSDKHSDLLSNSFASFLPDFSNSFVTSPAPHSQTQPPPANGNSPLSPAMGLTASLGSVAGHKVDERHETFAGLLSDLASPVAPQYGTQSSMRGAEENMAFAGLVSDLASPLAPAHNVQPSMRAPLDKDTAFASLVSDLASKAARPASGSVSEGSQATRSMLSPMRAQTMSTLFPTEAPAAHMPSAHSLPATRQAGAELFPSLYSEGSSGIGQAHSFLANSVGGIGWDPSGAGATYAGQPGMNVFAGFNDNVNKASKTQNDLNDNIFIHTSTASAFGTTTPAAAAVVASWPAASDAHLLPNAGIGASVSSLPGTNGAEWIGLDAFAGVPRRGLEGVVKRQAQSSPTALPTSSDTFGLEPKPTQQSGMAASLDATSQSATAGFDGLFGADFSGSSPATAGMDMQDWPGALSHQLPTAGPADATAAQESKKGSWI